MIRVMRVVTAIAVAIALVALVGLFVSAILPADPPGNPIIFPSTTPYPSNWTYTP